MKVFLRLFLLVVLLIGYSIPAFSLNLYITDPRNSFTKYPGTIEDLTMTVKPHGTYFEVALFLTFSPKGSIYDSEDDTLEVVMDFELHENAFINDLWLFKDDSVFIRARLIDKWTAGFVYESIVDRRLDPSILYKVDQGKYKLKLFPLIGNATRTVRINYFVPATWIQDHVFAPIPFHFLNASYSKPQKVTVHTYPNDTFNQPAFMDNPEIEFEWSDSRRYGESYIAEINLTQIKDVSILSFKNNHKQSVFGNLSHGEEGGYYQVLLNSKKIFDINIPKKMVFCIDYENDKSNFSREDVFKTLKQVIYETMTPKDSFNIFLSNNKIIKVSDSFLPADSAHVEEVFNRFLSDTLSINTHLPELFFSSIDWINSKTNKAEILFIANSDSHGDQETANKLGEEILSRIESDIKISFASFLQKNWARHLIAGIGYAGNDYLYLNLCRITKGIFNKTLDFNNKLYNLLYYTMNNVIGSYENIELSTYLENGYTYDNVDYNTNYHLAQKDFIIKYGRFFGKPPIKLELTGYYRKVPFHKSFEICDDEFSNQYDNKTLWAGNSLLEMERERSNEYTLIYEVINKSIDYRVLSTYTAFLATEDDEVDTLTSDEPNGIAELMVFEANSIEPGIDLRWTTAEETNTYGFYVEKRGKPDGKSFSSVGFIKGAGNSSSNKHYRYLDSDVIPYASYEYRLRQVDLDGTSSLSKTITVTYTPEYKLSLRQNSPNPFFNETRISFSLPEIAHVRMEIHDLYGKIVATLIDRQLPPDHYELYWNGMSASGERLPNGTYFCRLSAGAATRTIKMIKGT